MENHNRSWMYDRTYDQRWGLKPSFIKGVNEFVDVCTRTHEFLRGGLVRCQCGTFKQLIDIKIDLYTHGFKPNYWVWTEHGEEIPTENQIRIEEDIENCCVNGCMIYYKEDKDLRQCKFCGKQKFKPRKGKNKEVPYKRMHYLPLIPRLQRLYASMSTAPHMLWHHRNRRKICH
ncbi:hypothetical protein Ahy_B08g092180 [Arachis hypogaea]|uniref:Transposase-associated domain-containing protein n=1 Tax=Arachis hypogaea TaxID=3818 RepID=A0A444Y3D3_ARAHY|nr:hypothetical protein Ahy_B08g092180 [Arachis hypogaea]